MIWWEKHRPENLDAMALKPKHRKKLNRYIDKGEIPHLVITGPYGSGKTTLATILIDQLECTELTVNGGENGNIKYMRDKVYLFIRGRISGDWNIVFLDEAQHVTNNAWKPLPVWMEKYSSNARFIFTATEREHLPDSIRSRCEVFDLSDVPAEERERAMYRVLEAEDVDVPPETVEECATEYTDMREGLRHLQDAALARAREVGNNGAEADSKPGEEGEKVVAPMDG